MDLQAIKARMREAREKWVDAAGFGFLVRRPSNLDFMRLAARGLDEKQRKIEIVLASVRDWRGITEAVLLGAAADPASPPVAFDSEAFELFIGDHLEIVLELAGAIAELYQAQAVKDAEKKT
jgi:hypothetical protein